MRSSRVFFLFALFLLACEAPASIGATCNATSNCASPLVCRLGRCRGECVENRDCPIGARCLLDQADQGSCSVDVDDRCESGGQACPTGLICVGDQCANSCEGDTDCPADGLCRVADTTDVRFCFAPDRGDAGVRFDAGADASRDDGGDQERDGGLDAGADGGTCGPGGCGTALELCLGSEFACAIRADHSIVCWGLNDYGQLGDGLGTVPSTHEICDDGDCSSRPVRVQQAIGGELFAERLACAGRTACAYDSSGFVSCWGDASDWQSGSDPAGGLIAAQAVRVPGVRVTTGQRLMAGDRFLCAESTEGPSCWGYTYFGKLGAREPGGPEVVIGAGELFATGINVCFADGTAVSCRGNDVTGQLGPFGTGSSSTFVALEPFPAPVASLVGSGLSLCALAGTDVLCWGSQDCGAHGTSGTGYTRVATPVGAGRAYDALWGGTTSPRFCARTLEGEVDCWGSFVDLCDIGASSAVTRVPALDGARTVAVGYRNACAIDAVGVVRCTGDGRYGLLGRTASGEVEPSFEPVCIADSCP
jgi:hypothetical protein